MNYSVLDKQEIITVRVDSSENAEFTFFGGRATVC